MSPTGLERRGDVLLSSGFLGFASHLGFLEGLRDVAFGVDALVGTSSGALLGSLFAANMPPNEIAQLLTKAAPITHVRLNKRPWVGLFELTPLVRLLERELPPSFEQMPIPFAVGVTTDSGQHQLINTGSVALAVAASCAVPGLFKPIAIAGASYCDGGASDRVGVTSWQTWRPRRFAVVHRIQRSMGVDSNAALTGLHVVVSPRSRNSLLRLRDFDAERQSARVRTRALFDAKRTQ